MASPSRDAPAQDVTGTVGPSLELVHITVHGRSTGAGSPLRSERAGATSADGPLLDRSPRPRGAL
ncbi:hypothetical protein, partial [Streptomyces europaeiscabiei]|uniref:hypothetical protein n=1 Tax=Streptomyces europaeiscabiei TaxID=146819 RepID=UPI0029B533D1